MSRITEYFAVRENRKKAAVTVGVLAVYVFALTAPVLRLGAGYTGRGMEYLQLLSLLTGGNLEQMNIFSLGVTPYINASIIVSLLGFMIPSLREIQKEGGAGKKFAKRITWTLTVVFAVMQAWGIVYIAAGTTAGIVMLLVLAGGSLALAGLGEWITEKGIGNGVSEIISTGILVRVPSQIRGIAHAVQTGSMDAWKAWTILAVTVALVALAVWFTLRTVRIPVAQAMKGTSGKETYLPLRMSNTGVMPMIFATTFLTMPGMIAAFMPGSGFAKWTQNAMSWSNPWMLVLYAFLIVFFNFYYSSMSCNPEELAEDLKKSGSAIRGVRPGEQTARYLAKEFRKLNITGSGVLVVTALTPMILSRVFSEAGLSFAGTSLLIVAGTVEEIVRQIKADYAMTRKIELF